VSITLNSVVQTVMTNSVGDFTTTSNTARLGVAGSPYPVTYSFAGNAVDNPASDNSTKVAVTKKHLTVTVKVGSSDIGHGDFVSAPSVSFSGFVNSDTASSVISGNNTYSGLPTASSPAGVYTVTPDTTALSATNYDFANVVSATINLHSVVTGILVEWRTESMSIRNLNRDLPFSDITRFEVTYSDPVNISGTGLTLTSAAGGSSYAPAKADSGQGVTAETWTLPTSIGIDRLMLALDQAHTVAASAPSLTLLGPTSLSFSVLPGDFTGDGSVSSADMTDINNATIGACNVWADILGTGTVNINDVKLSRSKIGTSLPPATT
jgi:hypothetical protein